MLNKLQKEQMAAAREALQKPSTIIPEGLFESYIDCVDDLKFAENAVRFKKESASITSLRKVSLNCSDVEFFVTNRAAITGVFERLAEEEQGLMNEAKTSIEVAVDLANQLVKETDALVTYNEAGFALYGTDTQSPALVKIAETAVTLIGNIAAELFFTAATELGGSLVEKDYFITEFLGRVQQGEFEFSWAMAKYIIDTLDDDTADVFAETALNYKPFSGAERTDGELLSLNYIQEHVHFYNFNKKDILEWLGCYAKHEGNELKSKNPVSLLFELIESYGLNPRKDDPAMSLHQISASLYGQDQELHKNHEVLTKAVMIFFIEELTMTYSKYYNDLF